MAYSSWPYVLVEVLACCMANMPATSVSLSRMPYCPKLLPPCAASISTARPGMRLSSTPGSGGGDSARGRLSTCEE